jgi:hypothetical protein
VPVFQNLNAKEPKKANANPKKRKNIPKTKIPKNN